MKLKNFLRIRWEPRSRKSLFHLSPQQGVLGSRVFCGWWLCHLVHGPGKKHPLPSPSGNLDYQDFDDLWPFYDLCVLYRVHLKFMPFEFFSFHTAESIGLYGFLKITILWIMNWIIWIPKNNQILFSTSCGKKPIINTKCHTIDISLFIWLKSISFNLSTFCFFIARLSIIKIIWRISRLVQSHIC